MVETYFPQLPTELRGHLETVRLHLIENPEYLDHPACPYSSDLRSFLKDLFGRGGVARAPSVGGDDEEEDLELKDLRAEVTRMMKEMRKFGESLGEADKASDRAAYFRVAAGLLEKLIMLEEKATGVQQFSRLIQFLTRFAEDHLSPDQRTKMIDALKTFGDAA